VWSIVLLALGLLLLVLFLIRMYRTVRRFRAVEKHVAADLKDRSGLVKARMAGIRVGIAERRHRSID
jgi:hypothetical protein